MKATTNEQQNVNQHLSAVGVSLIIMIAIVLFGFVVNRTGLPNRFRNAEAAVPTKTVLVAAEAMRFEPDKVRLSVGQEVTLLLKNRDMYGHSFDIDELDLHILMPGNSESEQTVTFTEVGTYTIYCGLPGHREAGMVGTLIIEEG